MRRPMTLRSLALSIFLFAGALCDCTPAYDSGDRTASITVTISAGTQAVGSTGPASNLVDGASADNNTDSIFFTGGAAAAGAYLRFDFGASVKIVEATWAQSTNASHGVWIWQGCQSAWAGCQDIGTSFTLGGSAPQTQTSLAVNGQGFRYYQLIGVSGTTSSAPWIREITFKRCSC